MCVGQTAIICRIDHNLNSFSFSKMVLPNICKCIRSAF